MSKGLFKKNEIELGGDAEVTCVRKKARQVPEQRLSGILLETVPQDERHHPSSSSLDLPLYLLALPKYIICSINAC